MNRRIAYILALSFVASFASPARAQLETRHQLVFTSGIGGHFAEPVCEGDIDFERSAFANSANAIATAAADPETFVFDTGGFFDPHGVGRFALQRETAQLVSLVAALGYDALALSTKDLQSSREPMVRLSRALREAGIPMLAHNLRCDAVASSLCESVDDVSEPLRLFESGPDKLALISLIDPDVLVNVAEENTRGITLDSVEESIARRVREAREAGATIVLVTIDNGSGARAAGEAIALAESLPEADRPDLLVSARAGRDLLFARPASFWPPIASSPTGGAARAELRSRSDLEGFELLVRPLPSVEGSLPALDQFVATLGPVYCDELGHATPGGRLSSAIDREGFADLTGGAIRVGADAEIAIVNTPLVANNFALEAGRVITPSDLFLAIQFDEPIYVARVEGAWLQGAARNVAAHPSIRSIGLTISNPGAANESIKINGRVLDTRGRYIVAVPRFLATGGDGVLPAGPEWKEVQGGTTVRGSLFDFLGIARTTDPRAALPDPAERLEWSFAFASDTSVGTSTNVNTGSYADTQFDRADNITYGTENQLDLIARSTNLTWENQGILRYRTTRVRPDGPAESDDIISLRTTFTYNRPRIRHPHWYMPTPYAETYAETEFTVPDTRTARHFLVRPTVGARFSLTRVLSLKLQAGGSFELFDRAVAPSPGVGAVATLANWRFFEVGRKNGSLEGTFDWFLSGLGETPRHTLRGNLVLAIQLNQVLGVSFSSTLFAVKERPSDFSYVLNTTANLRLRWFVRTQR